MTLLWPMAIGACATMGFIQLWVGFRRLPGTANLLFALNAFVVAGYAYFELALTRTDSIAGYLTLLRGLDIMAGLQVVTTAAFVQVYFGTGRKWLAFLAPSLSCVALIADFMPQPKMVYLQITGIRKIATFGGATYTIAEGVENPLNALFYMGVLLLLVFVVDASVLLWHRGERRRAAIIGGTITFFILTGGTQAALVDNGIIRTPYLLSFAYLAILIAMGVELSNDVLNAAQLASDLRVSQQQMVMANDSAKHLCGRLIQMEEHERMRLARELHDDLSQGLALLSVELEMVGQNPEMQPQKIAERMAEFSTRVKGLSSEVHQISHNLHPATLEQLGLAAAVGGFCKGFALVHEMAIEFSEHQVPRKVPDDMALCFYRIVQESLQNVVKHSGGTMAKVEIAYNGEQLTLVIADDGNGFDPVTTPLSGSLGLVSMRERAHFIGGQLSIKSRPGAGTRVELNVPIAAVNHDSIFVVESEEIT